MNTVAAPSAAPSPAPTVSARSSSRLASALSPLQVRKRHTDDIAAAADVRLRTGAAAMRCDALLIALPAAQVLVVVTTATLALL